MYPPKLSSYLVPASCPGSSLYSNGMLALSPPPPRRAHPSLLQPVSSATAALSATSEPGCFAIII